MVLACRINLTGRESIMSKTIQIFSIFILTITLLGSLLIPNNPMFWLATPSVTFNIARAVLIFIIYAFLLFGAPPSKNLRIIVGGMAAFLIGWALITTYNETTQLLDGLTFAAAGVALLLNVMQPDYGAQGEENWGLITQKLSPHYALLHRQAAYYALVVFMVFGIYGSSLQNNSHHIRHLFT
jgi:hypothetical protein